MRDGVFSRLIRGLPKKEVAAWKKERLREQRARVLGERPSSSPAVLAIVLLLSACSRDSVTSGADTTESPGANRRMPTALPNGHSTTAPSSKAAVGPTVAGRVLRAPLVDGYESLGADEADAKQVIEAGGVVLRQRGDANGAILGATPMPGLQIDPVAPEVCSAASQAAARDNGTTLISAEVATVRGTPVCRAEFAVSDAKPVNRTFTWLLDPSAKLGVMVVCTFDPADDAAERACLELAGGVAAVGG